MAAQHVERDQPVALHQSVVEKDDVEGGAVEHGREFGDAAALLELQVQLGLAADAAQAGAVDLAVVEDEGPRIGGGHRDFAAGAVEKRGGCGHLHRPWIAGKVGSVAAGSGQAGLGASGKVTAPE